MNLSGRKTRFVVTGIAVYVVLMLICTFGDLKIAMFLYNPDSAFGQFFNLIGTAPMPVVGIFCCEALVVTARRELYHDTVLSYAIGGGLLVYFFFYAFRTFYYILPSGSKVTFVAMAIWVVVSIYLTQMIVRKGRATALRQTSLIGISGGVASTLLIMLIKVIISRPRFVTLTDPSHEFTFWFQRQTFSIFSLNSSFPSGHVAQASLIFCLLLIPMIVGKHRKSYRYICIAAATAFTLCVMMSRLILGVHYATDVLTGAAIPLAAMRAAAFILDRVKCSQEPAQSATVADS